jgi:hypothetical protein
MRQYYWRELSIEWWEERASLADIAGSNRGQKRLQRASLADCFGLLTRNAIEMLTTKAATLLPDGVEFSRNLSSNSQQVSSEARK